MRIEDGAGWGWEDIANLRPHLLAVLKVWLDGVLALIQQTSEAVLESGKSANIMVGLSDSSGMKKITVALEDAVYMSLIDYVAAKSKNQGSRLSVSGSASELISGALAHSQRTEELVAS